MKKLVKVSCAVIIVIAVLLVGMVLFSDTPSESDSPHTQQNEIFVYSDENISVWYLNDVNENESLKGMCFFSLRVENKTDKTITFYPTDASVDGNMVQILSGMPLSLKPNTKGVNGFTFKYEDFASDISELAKIDFSAMLMDDNGDTVYTGNMEVDF